MKHLLVLGIFLLLLSCNNTNSATAETSSTHNKDSLHRVLTYGISQPGSSTAAVLVAKQYGFYYYPVTGCVITKQLIDSINKENDNVYRAIAKEYGENWQEGYTNKTDSLSRLLQQVKGMVIQQSDVQQISKQHTGGLYYHIAPTDTAQLFNVQAFISNANQLIFICKVNLQTREVVRIP